MNNNSDNFGQRRAPRRKKSDPDLVWNLLTLVMLIGTVCVAGVSYSLFMNPYSDLNPFPPNTPQPTLPPPTWTPISFGPTWTPTVTMTPMPTLSPRPTFTLEPSNTPFSLATPTSALTPTITAKPTGVPYAATITYHDSTTFRPETNCTMLLIAGRVQDSSNKPVIGAIVKLGGGLPGKSFTPPSLTYSGVVDFYGRSGFEFDPKVEPVDSDKTLWVQLFDQSNAPLSNQIFLTTSKDCKKNLVLVTFQEK
jgi:hypothetical protein